jgi:hypothetical protein
MVVFWLGALSSAQAEIYKCVRPDGTTLFTSDPAQAPADCRPELIDPLPPLGVLPESVAPAPPERTPASGSRQSPEAAGKSAAAYTTEATALANQYDAARRTLYRASMVVDQLAARREMSEIRQRKILLLEEVDRSSLGSAEKRSIGEILAPISD